MHKRGLPRWRKVSQYSPQILLYHQLCFFHISDALKKNPHFWQQDFNNRVFCYLNCQAVQTIRRGNIGHFQTTNTCSKLDCEILLIAGKTAIFLHNRKLNNCSACPLNIYLIQRQRIWKPAAITNLLTRNLEMQMFATQLGGQVVPTSFKPVPFTLLKDPPPRTKGTGFCCLSLFFCHDSFAMLRLHDDKVVVNCSYGATTAHFAQRNSINWADSAHEHDKRRAIGINRECACLKSVTSLAVCVFQKNPLWAPFSKTSVMDHLKRQQEAETQQTFAFHLKTIVV